MQKGALKLVQVMLAEVATLSLSGGPALIERYNRTRNIVFVIELSGVGLGDAKNLVNQLPSIRDLPSGVRLVEVGDAEIMGELFASFALAMLTGILCIYLVLVLLFKSVLHPITILAALPLSLGGAFVGLLCRLKVDRLGHFVLQDQQANAIPSGIVGKIGT